MRKGRAPKRKVADLPATWDPVEQWEANYVRANPKPAVPNVEHELRTVADRARRALGDGASLDEVGAAGLRVVHSVGTAGRDVPRAFGCFSWIVVGAVGWWFAPALGYSGPVGGVAGLVLLTVGVFGAHLSARTSKSALESRRRRHIENRVEREVAATRPRLEAQAQEATEQVVRWQATKDAALERFRRDFANDVAMLESDEFLDEFLRRLPPERFEELIAALYRAKGFRASKTPRSGDQGIDLQCENGDISLAIQCKRYNGAAIGGPVIRELLGSTQNLSRKTSKSWRPTLVHTFGAITRQAQEHIAENNILVVGADDLRPSIRSAKLLRTDTRWLDAVKAAIAGTSASNRRSSPQMTTTAVRNTETVAAPQAAAVSTQAPRTTSSVLERLVEVTPALRGAVCRKCHAPATLVLGAGGPYTKCTTVGCREDRDVSHRTRMRFIEEAPLLCPGCQGRGKNIGGAKGDRLKCTECGRVDSWSEAHVWYAVKRA